MKKLVLLAIILISISADAQTSVQDSINRAQRVQDSIRDQELLDILKPLEVKETPTVQVVEPKQDTIKPKVITPDTLKNQPLVDPPNTNPKPDTLKNQPLIDPPKQNLESDTLKNQPITAPPKTNLAPDTLKNQIDTSSVQPKQQPDSVKSKPVITDSIKPKPVMDSIPPRVVPPDTLKPKAPIDSLKTTPLPPDTLDNKNSVATSTVDVRSLPLDSLSPEQLLIYYQTEPDPPQFYRGPDVGDSVFYVLNPLTLPTTTVDGYALGSHGDGISAAEDPLDTISAAEQRLKPKLSFGAGRMSFSGDLYSKHFQALSMGRPAFDMSISHRITRYLQVDFSVLFGKLGGNERLGYRNENFSSEIRAGGLNLVYDFGNFIPSQYKIRPFVSIGAYGFEFLSKTDLMDRSGNLYYYWSDGSIKNMPEGSAGAQNAIDLQRDYIYESDIREKNTDGFGKYRERAFAFPVGAGFIMKVTDRVDLKLNFQYYLSTTDYIDGISNKSTGERVGTKAKDNWAYTSFAVQYDLIAKNRAKYKRFKDTLTSAEWFAIDNADTDEDGVIDVQDDCLGTANGAKVDLKGCPLDEDVDGVPNYRDDELTTAPGVPVNARGVTQSDEYWQNWYNDYLNDSVATDKTTESVGNIYAAVAKKTQPKKDNFTVELVRYAGPIPSDELAFLLSIGDINSVTMDDGTTVVYTSGSYDKLSTAIKRRDEFRTTGSKGAGISRIQGKEIVQVTDDELQKLLAIEIADLLNVSVGDSAVGTVLPEEVGTFTREDIVYRVQLGAFKNKISTKVFNTSAGVLELKTGENVYRYVTKGYKSIGDAAAVRADLVVQGYSDAFVTAYKGGKRIPMSETGATMDKGYKEDLSEDKTFNSIDKRLLAFKIQLGPLKKPAQEAAMDEKVKELAAIDKQTTSSGNIRYTAGGEFSRLDAAEKLRKELEDKGYTDAFIIATFKNEIISIQEAMELLK